MVSAVPISSQYVSEITVTAVFTALAAVIVVLRFLSRRLRSNFGADDWTIVGAFICSVGFLTIQILVARYGMAGYPIAEVDLPHLVVYAKLLLANNEIYNTSIVLSKLSILLMYRRIFTTPSFRRMTWPVFFLLAAYWLCCFWTELFAYSPINGQWNPTIKSTSIDVLKFSIAMAGYNIGLDVIILILPQFQVWQLQMSRQKQILVSLVFLLGGVVCIASTVRLVYLVRVSFSDATDTLSLAGTWTGVEINTAIVCACLPAMPPIFKHWFGESKDGKNPISSYLRQKLSGWARFGRSGEADSFSKLDPLESSRPASSLGSRGQGLRSARDGRNISAVEATPKDSYNLAEVQNVWVRRDVAVRESTQSQDV